MMRALVGALMIALAGNAVASEREWDVSFAHADTYLSALGASSPALLLAGAGHEKSPNEAVKALNKALAKRARLVMDAAALGNVSDLDDAAIVKRSAALPIDVVVIVRVFIGEAGHDAAIVTFYDKKATPLTAFSGVAGTPVPAYAAAQGSGVSIEASDAISSVLKHNETTATAAPDTRSPAQKQYDSWFIGFFETTPAHSNRELENNSCPYQGVSHVPLCGQQFFDTVGHPDLYRLQSSRSHARAALIATGTILLAAGAVTAIVGGVGRTSCREQNVDLSCIDTHRTINVPALGVGGGLLGVGLVEIIAGAALPNRHVAPAEVYELAREYNKALRRRVGLPDAAMDEHVPHD